MLHMLHTQPQGGVSPEDPLLVVPPFCVPVESTMSEEEKIPLQEVAVPTMSEEEEIPLQEVPVPRRLFQIQI